MREVPEPAAEVREGVGDELGRRGEGRRKFSGPFMVSWRVADFLRLTECGSKVFNGCASLVLPSLRDEFLAAECAIVSRFTVTKATRSFVGRTARVFTARR